MKKLVISHSQMTLYETCPQLWYYRYVQKIPMFKGPALYFGSNVHSMIEAELKQQQSGVSLKSFNYDRKDPAGALKKAEILRDAGMEILQNHDDLMFPGVQNIKKNEVEWRFSIDNPGFRGVIDLVYHNNDGDAFIIDWKTTSREYSPHDIASAPQLTAYAWAYLQQYNELPRAVCFITLDKITKKASVYMGRRTGNDIEEYKKRVHRNYRDMQEKLIYRKEDGCDTPYGPCQFKSDCWRVNDVVIKQTAPMPELNPPKSNVPDWY